MKDTINKLLIAAISLFAAFTIKAESTVVSGKIVASDGASVPYCNVIFTSPSDSLKFYGMAASEEGIFKLDVPAGEYDMRVSMIGFDTYTKRVSVQQNSDFGKISLSESSVELDEAEVVASRIQRKAGSFIFNAEGSKLAQGRNSLELLNYAPGVWYSKINGLSVNGNTNIRVMLNNRYLKMSGEELMAYLETIPSESILSVEVFTQTGANEDADMQGALIKIRLKKQAVEGLKGSVSGSYAYNKTGTASYKPNLSLDYRYNKWSLYLNAGLKYNNKFQYNTEKTNYTDQDLKMISDFKHESQDTYYYSRFGSVYDVTKRQSLGIDIDLSYNPSQGDAFSDNTTILNRNTTYGRSVLAKDDTQRNYNVSVNYKLQTDDKGSNLSVIADYFHKYKDETEENNFSESEVLTSQIRTDNDSKKSNYSARADYQHKLDEKIQISGGVKYSQSKMETELLGLNYNFDSHNWDTDMNQTDDYTYNERIMAGYVNTSFSIKAFSVNAGLRIENTQLDPKSKYNGDKVRTQNYTDYFPSIQTMWSIDPKKGHSVSASYKKSIYRPSFGLLNPFTQRLNSYTKIVGNPDLQPVFRDKIELKVNLFNCFGVYGNYYHAKGEINQIVMQDPDDASGLVYKNMNVKSTTTYCAGGYLTLNPTKWWRMDLNGEWEDKETEVNGRDTRARNYNLSISQNFTLPNDWSCGMGGFYMSGKVWGNMKTEDYYGLGVFANKLMLKKKLNVNIYCNSIQSLWMSDRPFIINIEGDNFTKRLNQTSTEFHINAGISIRYSFSAGKKVNVKKVKAGNSEERDR